MKRRNLIYTPGRYTPMPGKSETYRVERDNAELRHYLARLARLSRCFSRCIDALRRAIKLFTLGIGGSSIASTSPAIPPTSLNSLTYDLCHSRTIFFVGARSRIALK